MNQLIGDSVAPVVVAFVESLQSAARDEFGGAKSSDYVRMLADELIPQLDEKYRIQAKPKARAIMGAGAGALMAALAAVERPDVFGNAGGCSFYLPGQAGDMLTKAIEESDGQNKPRFLVMWNRYELRREEWGVDLGRDSKRVVEALEAKDYSVVAMEVIDSSGWGGWRVRAGEVLEQFFPQ